MELGLEEVWVGLAMELEEAWVGQAVMELEVELVGLVGLVE